MVRKLAIRLASAVMATAAAVSAASAGVSVGVGVGVPGYYGPGYYGPGYGYSAPPPPPPPYYGGAYYGGCRKVFVGYKNKQVWNGSYYVWKKKPVYRTVCG